MEDLKSLRSRLMTLQQKSSGNRLSERNVVEILQKLVEKFNLQIIYCLSGKDYLTPSRLLQEIKKEVLQEGRINLLDLPSILNVSIENIENRVSAVLSDKIVLINGQLMSSFYIESLCAEINLSLQESGQIQLSDLTVKHALPMNFLKQELEKRFNKGLQGQFSGNTLVTDTYIVRHMGRLRGTLRAATKPIDLKSFDPSLVVAQTKQLIESGQVLGKIDGTVFTPAAFQDTVWAEIKDFFFVNKFVEFEYLKKRIQVLGVNDFRDVCEQLGPGEYFHSSFISVELQSEIREKVISFMAHKDFTDFFEIDLPACVDEEDIEQFIGTGLYCYSHFIYADSAVDKAVQLLNPLLAGFVEEVKDSKSKKKETLGLQTIQNELKKKKFLAAPAEFLEGFCDAVYSKVGETIANRRESRGKPVQDQDNLPQDFNYLFLCNKSLQTLAKIYKNTKPIQVHVMKTVASAFFSDLLKMQLNHHGHQVAAVAANDRVKLVQKLPDYLKEIFGRLLEKISSKDLDGFIQELLTSKKDIPVLSVKAVDKKTERNVMHKLRSDTKTKVMTAVSSRNWIEVGVLAAKVKLIDNSYLIEVPSEKWAGSLIFELYSTISTPDVLTDFLQKLSESAPDEVLFELSSRLVDFISS